MNIVNLAPGVVVLLHGRKRTVERIIMHPAGPVVKFKTYSLAWIRNTYPLAELVREGAEVVA